MMPYPGVPYVKGAIYVNMANRAMLNTTRITGPLRPISEYCEGRRRVLGPATEIG